MTCFDDFEVKPLSINKDRSLVTRWKQILIRVCFAIRGNVDRRIQNSPGRDKRLFHY
jgi:hypothetical protein